ncbi:uncharacterized protein LOC119630109 [Bombyx mori]|uniref:Uncharacterized protein n=1 Tax=Bombyx mori TaxID=7091 RepID=A0A8R2R2W3_BOMMO|nr:uncharacterized protein LOC119628504 [Bombyx mori]XP_037870880.1 uncharacterized protein LOC119629358 [Bombyx mori]XP_037874418.1 uncharacterized protein LOC119630109 [Bombyx mori]XP_037874517.1 uncharacterized protein LOC119630125 [Bombyx mori]
MWLWWHRVLIVNSYVNSPDNKLQTRWIRTVLVRTLMLTSAAIQCAPFKMEIWCSCVRQAKLRASWTQECEGQVTGSYGNTTQAAAEYIILWRGEWTPDVCTAFSESDEHPVSEAIDHAEAVEDPFSDSDRITGEDAPPSGEAV